MLPAAGRHRRADVLYGGALAGGCLLIYLATLAPTITWRNGGADGAELAAAAYVWGVAHPPGYPLYLTLVRLAQYLPVGDPAYRANLFSAAAAAAAAVLAYVTTLELLRAGTGHSTRRDRAGALFAGATLAFGPLLWSQAVVAEVYTLGAALVAATLWCAARWWTRPDRPRTLWLAAAAALLASHQPVFVVPLAPLAVFVARRVPLGLAVAAAAMTLLCPGLLATLWLRALLQPTMNWGDPSTPGRWLDHVTAAIYRSYFLARPWTEELPRVPAAMVILARQSGWPGLALACLGAAWLWDHRRGYAAWLGFLAAFFLGFAVLYNAQDSEVYLLPTVTALALAAGLGAAWALHALSRRTALLAAVGLAMLVGWQLVSGWSAVDASGDLEAWRWGEATLRTAPPQAVIRAAGDKETFALWYLQRVHRLRPDVAIVDEGLLPFGWYRGQLLREYPQLAGEVSAP